MAQLQITIDLDNAAFDDAPETEITRILRIIANDYYDAKEINKWQNVHDINGNPVGKFKVDKDTPPSFS